RDRNVTGVQTCALPISYSRRLLQGGVMINRALVATNILLLIVVIVSCASTRSTKPASLTLSELNIVDDKGVVRVRISGDLPDAEIGRASCRERVHVAKA